jgi:hypothetical protein
LSRWQQRRTLGWAGRGLAGRSGLSQLNSKFGTDSLRTTVLYSSLHMSTFLKISFLLSFAVLRHAAMAAPSLPSTPYIENFSCDHGPFGLRLPSDARALSQLAPILQSRSGKAEEWENYRTTRTYVRYSGLDLGYVAFSNDPARYLISYVEVSKPDWQITGPFQVGQTVSTVQSILGLGAQDDSGLKRSYGSEGATVTFEQTKGKITKIKYECYTG